MGDRRTDAAAVPDAGGDTLREQLARIIKMQIVSGHPDAVRPLPLADAMLPRIREHVAAAVQTERERASSAIAALLAAHEDIESLRQRTDYHQRNAERSRVDYDDLHELYGKVLVRAEKAEAAIERVRARCETAGTIQPPFAQSARTLTVAEVLAALDRTEATDG